MCQSANYEQAKEIEAGSLKEQLQIFKGQFDLLEERMVNLSKYVAFHGHNNSCFSPELCSIFINVCSEIDSLAAMLCKQKHNKPIKNMIDKLDTICQWCPNLKSQCVELKLTFIESIHFVPFQNFEKDNSTWWTAYNKVKHNRTETDPKTEKGNYELANLKNVLLAMAGLYILLSLLQKETSPQKETEIVLRLRLDGSEAKLLPELQALRSDSIHSRLFGRITG